MGIALSTKFTATHVHVEGGQYEVLDYPRLKDPVTKQWIGGVLYRNLEDVLCVRALSNFNERFKPL